MGLNSWKTLASKLEQFDAPQFVKIRKKTQKENISAFTEKRPKKSKPNTEAKRNKQSQTTVASQDLEVKATLSENLQPKQPQRKTAVKDSAEKPKHIFSRSQQKTELPDPILTEAVQDFIAMAIPRCIDDYLRSLTLLSVNMQAAKGLSNTIVKASRMLRKEQANERL